MSSRVIPGFKNFKTAGFTPSNTGTQPNSHSSLDAFNDFSEGQVQYDRAVDRPVLP
jgi:hypothetical protein